MLSTSSSTARLNAPFGARCFLACSSPDDRFRIGFVIMHLLALGAFWPPGQPPSTHKPPIGLNAPFGARCFLAIQASCLSGTCTGVLMHLLVLGAFWHGTVCTVQRRGQNVLMHLLALGAFWHQGSTQPRARNGFSRLNAPFGARCFLAHPRQVQGRHRPVLMHLLALGAFWPTRRKLIVFVHFRES